MKRPVSSDSHLVACRGTGCQPVLHGFTLVEILVATTLALLLMGAVAVMFGRVAESITDSRSMLEAADRLRLAETRLQMDLAGITATVSPPLKPENNEGYFEYIEGPALAVMLPTIAKNSDTGGDDQTVGDFDDILMFTTRTTGKPFVGRCGVGATIQSDVAEVAWFLRGRTLHRRVLLVAPSATIPTNEIGYYSNYDISARTDSGANTLRANTLGDLTRPQRRFAHPPTAPLVPSNVRLWHWTNSGYSFPTLPTIRECSGSTATSAWSTEEMPGSPPTPAPLDFWTNASGHRVPDDAYVTTGGFRISDDVILTNVIGFDVKAWDPTAGAYKDLGYLDTVFGSTNANGLGHNGQLPLQGSDTIARVYDTWSTTYFGNIWADGIDLDNSGFANGIVDDDTEKINPPPYPIPLRGIQVKIRVFEPDSRQIREVTVVQEFLPR